LNKLRVIFILLLIVFLTNITIESKPFTQISVAEIQYTHSSLTEHEPIVIASADDFTLLGFPGDGTENFPYLIEGLNITTTMGPGIVISNVSVHYVISNCVLTGPVYAPNGLIAVFGKGNGRIIDSQLSNSAIGIYLENCSSIEITGNTFSNFTYESLWSYNSNTSINDNHFVVDNYSTRGIYIDHCESTYISNNYYDISQGAAAIFIDAAGYVEITSCEFYGLNLGARGIWTFEHNITEIVIQHSSFNYIDGPLEFEFGIALGHDGYIENVRIDNCSGDIFIGDKITGNVSITRNTAQGIYVESGSGCLVEGNTIYNNPQTGIMLRSNHTQVYNNTISSCRAGIGVLCHENIIKNNSVSNNGVGIYIDGDLNQVYYNTFMNNTDDAFDYGINNIWDDNVSMGNYWDTPSVNGIHPINGSAGSVDRFPIYIEVTTTSTDTTTNTTNVENAGILAIAFPLAVTSIVAIILFVLVRKYPFKS